MKFVKLIFVLYSCIYCSCTFCQPTTKFLDEFDIQPVKRQFVISHSLLYSHEVKYGLLEKLSLGLGISLVDPDNGIMHSLLILNYKEKLSRRLSFKLNSKLELFNTNDKNKHFQYMNLGTNFKYNIANINFIINFGISKFSIWNYYNGLSYLFYEDDPKFYHFIESDFDGKFRPYLGIDIGLKFAKNNFILWDYCLQNLVDPDGQKTYFKMRDIAYRHIFKNIGFDIGIYRYSSKGYWPKTTLFYGIGKNKKLVSPF